jgi:hypothetical protein
MVMTNGSASHKHNMDNFTLAGMSMPNNTTKVYNGTVTITMREGPVHDVPMNATVTDDNIISFWLDPSKIDNHFGNTPIYGIVTKAVEIIKSDPVGGTDPEETQQTGAGTAGVAQNLTGGAPPVGGAAPVGGAPPVGGAAPVGGAPPAVGGQQQPQQLAGPQGGAPPVGGAPPAVGGQPQPQQLAGPQGGAAQLDEEGGNGEGENIEDEDVNGDVNGDGEGEENIEDGEGEENIEDGEGEENIEDGEGEEN